MTSDADPKTRALALQLQAAGPDEFPFGYFLSLAELRLRDEEA